MEAKTNCTLYINNLNEKVKKDELKKSLYHLFSQFGSVIDIVALKTIKMRGQAFVVFRDVASATVALRSLQGAPFYNKNMKIAFGQSESEATQKRQGTFRIKKKEDESKDGAPKKKEKRKPADSAADTNGDFSAFAPVSASDDSENPPNTILFVSNLPTGGAGSAETLTAVFGPYDGFKEVRAVPGRQDIAFVEFIAEQNAVTARDALNGYRITPTNPISVTYAKR